MFSDCEIVNDGVSQGTVLLNMAFPLNFIFYGTFFHQLKLQRRK